MSPDLTILCALNPGDQLTAESVVLGEGYVRVTASDLTNIDDDGVDPEARIVVLDEGKARELFNWLGVWLHQL